MLMCRAKQHPGARRADERVVLVITGDGLKTLDAVRDTFTAYEIDASLDQFIERVESEVRV